MPTLSNVKKIQIKQLINYGYMLLEPSNQYQELRLQKHASLTLYKSGKLVIQGKDEYVKEAMELLKNLNIGTNNEINFKKQVGIYIGSDESLKGDTFGGIVVASVKANDQQRKQLEQLGIKDSKKLTDDRIAIFAEQIKKIVPYCIKELTPEKYNRFPGVTFILNNLHTECLQKLNEKGAKLVIDRYPGCNVKAIQEIKAESKYVEVAAASILARAVAVKQIQTLTKRTKFKIPKGSTHVQRALEQLKKNKLDPKKFVKMHFKNVQKYFK